MTVDRTSSDSTLPWRSYDCRQHCVGEYTAVEALGLSAIQCRIVHCRGGPVTLGNTVSDSYTTVEALWLSAIQCRIVHCR